MSSFNGDFEFKKLENSSAGSNFKNKPDDANKFTGIKDDIKKMKKRNIRSSYVNHAENHFGRSSREEECKRERERSLMKNQFSYSLLNSTFSFTSTNQKCNTNSKNVLPINTTYPRQSNFPVIFVFKYGLFTSKIPN